MQDSQYLRGPTFSTSASAAADRPWALLGFAIWRLGAVKTAPLLPLSQKLQTLVGSLASEWQCVAVGVQSCAAAGGGVRALAALLSAVQSHMHVAPAAHLPPIAANTWPLLYLPPIAAPAADCRSLHLPCLCHPALLVAVVWPTWRLSSYLRWRTAALAGLRVFIFALPVNYNPSTFDGLVPAPATSRFAWVPNASHLLMGEC